MFFTYKKIHWHVLNSHVLNIAMQKPWKLSLSGICNLESEHIPGKKNAESYQFRVSNFCENRQEIVAKVALFSHSAFHNPESVHFPGS